MKKNKFLLLAFVLVLVGCSASNISPVRAASDDEDTYPVINIDDYDVKETGELGSFNLVGPMNHLVTDEIISTFSWEESTNAVTYTLEICSSDQFVRGVDTIDYYIKENITTTSFNINSNYAYRDTDYYWRVTAKNDAGTKLCEEVFSFYLKAPSIEEVEFDLGEADDWQNHPLGSQADISIDNSNFFGNDKESLKVSFKQEDTKRGIVESDGWIIVTKTMEKNIYGTDALFFNMYYAGQDATVIIRLVDRDNEYWYTQVQVSNNAKQSVILKFADFVQRTKDVTVGNMTFNYERIKYFEVVFEKTFGDGVLLLSNVKAIKFDNYRFMFIDKLNFNDYEDNLYVNDNYDFEVAKTDDELTMSHYGSVSGKKKINGYGFVKLYVNRYLLEGDAIKVSIKYTGSKGTNIVLRLYEEDTDRWSYSLPYSALTVDEYRELVIPLTAFAKSYVQGDGKRQLFFIINIQFGLEGQYGTGKLFFKDFEVVKTADYQLESKREVGADGLIEDFSNYELSADLFKIWSHSENNKDEFISLNTSTKVVGKDNTVCGQFYYKADMEAALYYIPVHIEDEFTSLSIWLADQSVKSGNEKVSFIKNVNPDLVLQLRLVTGEIYTYPLNSLSKVWHEYDVPFSLFKLSNKADIRGTPKEIISTNISHIGFSIQFFYKDSRGNGIPVYASDNTVLVDNIAVSNYSEFKARTKEKVIAQEEDLAVIDDFEGYKTQEDLLDSWVMENSYDYQEIDLSDNVSSKGGMQSMKLKHQANQKESYYYCSSSVEPNVFSKVFKISMAAEAMATIHIDIYIKENNTQQKYRAIIHSINLEWTEYVLGLENFRLENTSTKFTGKYIPKITRICIGITFNDVENVDKYVFVDNLEFDKSQEYQSYRVNTRTVID